MNVVGHGRAVTEEHYLKENRMTDVENIYRMTDRLSNQSSTPSTPAFMRSILPSTVNNTPAPTTPSLTPTRASLDIDAYRRIEAERRLLLAPHLSWGQLHPDKYYILLFIILY